MTTDGTANASASLDARGRRCALLSMAISGKIGEVAPGEVLEVVSDDPGAPTEVPAWSRNNGHDLLSLERRGDEYRILIRRGP